MSYLLMKNALCSACTFCNISFSPSKHMCVSSSFLKSSLVWCKLIYTWITMLFECLTNNNISSSFGKMFFIHPLSPCEIMGKWQTITFLSFLVSLKNITYAVLGGYCHHAVWEYNWLYCMRRFHHFFIRAVNITSKEYLKFTSTYKLFKVMLMFSARYDERSLKTIYLIKLYR